MTKRERSSRPGRPSRERFADALLDQYLLDQYLLDRSSRDSGFGDRGWPDRGWPDRGWPDRGAMPGGDPAGSQPVAQVLAALTSAPESSELTGQARALAEFRTFAESGAFSAAPARGADLPPPAPRRDPGRTTWLPGGRLAVAAATGAVLMGGLLAVAYAGDLPVSAQRLAHNTIDAPAAGPDRDPAVSSQLTGSPNPAGRSSHQATHALGGPDRQVHSGSAAGHPHQPGSSSSPSASSSGRPGRSGQPGPTQAPSPSASISPPASVAPSPSAAPSSSRSGLPYPPQSPSSPQSTPP